MASSSSAPAPRPRPYEVFLSFRGEDTRNNFVSHLHSALVRRGIITYFDEKNLKKGQTIAVELPKAIQESSIVIVVFSKNYASSTWCLIELAKIVECKERLTIFPIFYDVDPSDVRKQRNSFFEAFSIHEANNKDKVQMINSWTEALREVANLTGMDVRGKNEASCIEEIVDEILRKLPSDASHFTKSGMESQISDLKILINKNPDEVRFIGLWGIGGNSKTAIARAIFEECESEFEGSCFLQNVARRKNEMVKLQQQLLYEVLKCKIEHIYDVHQGSNMIRKRMCDKRVLLVVHDVDNREQLNVLAGKSSWFGEGSKIVITCKDEFLLNDFYDKHEVDTLNANKARDHAFNVPEKLLLKAVKLGYEFKDSPPKAIRHAMGSAKYHVVTGPDKLDKQIDKQLDKLDKQFDKLDKQFDKLDKQIDKQIDKLDKQIDKLDKQFDKLDKQIDKQLDKLVFNAVNLMYSFKERKLLKWSQ